MKRFFNKKTAVLVVLFSCVSLAVSCVNTNYELSEDKVNTNVTIFQDGLTLPLGTTAPIKMEELYGMLDPELQEIIQNKDGKYGFSYSGNIDLTDTLAALKNVFAIDALSFNETFSFDLSNVSLDGVKFDALSIKPAPLSISGMLNIPDIALPQIKKKESLVHSLPSLDPDALKLSFDPIYNRIDVASFPGLIFNDIYMQYIDWADREMPYSEIKDRIEVINNMIPGKPLPSIPNIDINEGFKPFGETVTLALSLPSQIQAVRSVELNDNASIRISVNVINPLFTTGEVELDMNLSQIFSMEGADEKGHVISTFNVGKNSSQATREYKIKDLMLSSSDWKNNGSALALNKSFTVEVTPSIKQALTTLNYLRAYTYGGMGIELTIEFCNLSIDNVEMEIAPITISETIEMDINVPNVKLPDLVKKVEYVALENPLNISMKAELPKAFSQLCVNLKSLDIDFPKELVVSHDKYANGDQGCFMVN